MGSPVTGEYGGSSPLVTANASVAKRERGGLQNRHESARHRPGAPRLMRRKIQFAMLWIAKRLRAAADSVEKHAPVVNEGRPTLEDLMLENRRGDLK